jgi:gliding motility-associated-like protein
MNNVKQFNPSKTIIKKTEIVLNDGTCTFRYEAIAILRYDFTKLYLLLIPFIGWFILIAYTGFYFDCRFESLGEFDSLANTSYVQGTETSTLQLQANNDLNGIVVRCVITGCGAETITDTIRINVLQDDEVYIPSAFTPDGDGINDAFEIIGIEQIPDNTLVIFNRWGNVVFETSNYQNNWVGTSTSKLTIGEENLPTGTYYYLFDTKTDKFGILKGFVYLQR